MYQFSQNFLNYCWKFSDELEEIGTFKLPHFKDCIFSCLCHYWWYCLLYGLKIDLDSIVFLHFSNWNLNFLRFRWLYPFGQNRLYWTISKVWDFYFSLNLIDDYFWESLRLYLIAGWIVFALCISSWFSSISIFTLRDL